MIVTGLGGSQAWDDIFGSNVTWERRSYDLLKEKPCVSCVSHHRLVSQIWVFSRKGIKFLWSHWLCANPLCTVDHLLKLITSNLLDIPCNTWIPINISCFWNPSPIQFCLFFFFWVGPFPPFLLISWIFINVVPPLPKRLWPRGDFLRTWDNVFLGIWAEITQDLGSQGRRKWGPGSRQSFFQFWLLLWALCFWAKSLTLSDNWFYFKIREVIFYLIRLWERSEDLMTLVEAP